MLTPDGAHLLVQRRGDIDTTFELWSLDKASIDAQLEIAGTPALVSLDSSGSRIAIADYDRAVRVWDFHDGLTVVQLIWPPSRAKFILLREAKRSSGFLVKKGIAVAIGSTVKSIA